MTSPRCFIENPQKELKNSSVSFSTLFATHPPIQKRIEILENLKKGATAPRQEGGRAGGEAERLRDERRRDEETKRRRDEETERRRDEETERIPS